MFDDETTSLVAHQLRNHLHPASAGKVGSIHELRKSPGEGNDKPLQHSCLENPLDRGAWWATVHGVAKESDATQQLNNNLREISRTGKYIGKESS